MWFSSLYQTCYSCATLDLRYNCFSNVLLWLPYPEMSPFWFVVGWSILLLVLVLIPPAPQMLLLNPISFGVFCNLLKKHLDTMLMDMPVSWRTSASLLFTLTLYNITFAKFISSIVTSWICLSSQSDLDSQSLNCMLLKLFGLLHGVGWFLTGCKCGLIDGHVILHGFLYHLVLALLHNVRCFQLILGLLLCEHVAVSDVEFTFTIVTF